MCKYGEWLISTLSEAERRLFLKYCEIEEDYLNDAREQAFIQGYLTAIQHMARCQKIVPDGEDGAGCGPPMARRREKHPFAGCFSLILLVYFPLRRKYCITKPGKIPQAAARITALGG